MIWRLGDAWGDVPSAWLLVLLLNVAPAESVKRWIYTPESSHRVVARVGGGDAEKRI